MKVISSSTPLIQHVNNAIHNITNAKIKNSIGLESEYTKILEAASTFNDLERHVILQMDEVHIRSDEIEITLS